MIKLTISGDFAPNKALLDSITKADQDYFEQLRPVLNAADLNITNLECPVIEKSTPSDKYGPSLATDSRAIDVLKKGKFDAVTLANNHIMDHGNMGLSTTLRNLNDQGISFFGAGNNVTEANKPYIFEKDGKKIGFLNFAENEFSNTVDDNPGAAALDLIDNSSAIKKLKSAVDVLIVIVHGGAELHEYPSPRFKKTLRFMADQGANLVLAHHTHRYNGYEIYNGVPLFYGLGNFVFPSQSLKDEKWATGVLLDIKILNDNSIEFETIPFLQNFNQYNFKMMDGEKLESFRKSELEINTIIANDALLNAKYDEFFKKIENQYLHYLQPYTSKYFHKLYSLGILPSFLQNKTKRLLYLNLIRCEAHRDVVLKILK